MRGRLLAAATAAAMFRGARCRAQERLRLAQEVRARARCAAGGRPEGSRLAEVPAPGKGRCVPHSKRWEQLRMPLALPMSMSLLFPGGYGLAGVPGARLTGVSKQGQPDLRPRSQEGIQPLQACLVSFSAG